MNKPFKKITALILSVLLLLCACSQGESDVVHRTKKDKPAAAGPAVESGIFGKDISYSDSFTPAENAVLPINPAEAADMVGIKKSLCFLADGAVYAFDAKTGASGKLIDTDATMLSAYDDALYTYAPKSGKLCAYSTSGEVISESVLPLESDTLTVDDFYVTEGCYVFICTDSSKDINVVQYNAFDRETLGLANSFSEKPNMTAGKDVYSSYYGDSLLKTKEDPSDSRYLDIFEVNLEEGKLSKLSSVIVNPSFNSFDMTYNPQSGTAVFVTAPKEAGSEPMCIYELSLSDPDNIVHKRFYLDNAASERVFVNVYENVISAITSADSVYRSFDYLNQPESIILACNNASTYAPIISYFEQQTGVMVKTVDYGTDFDRLDIKLMAGDTDFDLFVPVYFNQNKYIISEMFMDLAQYDSLKNRLDGDVAAGSYSRFGDKYVGMPMSVYSSYTRDSYPEDGPSAYSRVISRMLYCAQNVDIVEGVYRDADGSELYKLLKYLYDNPNGNEAKMPFGKELRDLSGTFIMMNPNGAHKDNSVKFLECTFDALNGDAEGIIPESKQYMNLDSAEGYNIIWHFFAADYVEPILDASNSVSQCDGKSGTIKEIAREAAAQVRMRLEE